MRRITLTRVCAGVPTASLSFTPRTRDYQFLLEMFGAFPHYTDLGISKDDLNAEMVGSLLEECAKLCKNVLFPAYQAGDAGCVYKDGIVTTPKGFREAYDAMVQAQWTGISSPTAFGGQGLPTSIGYITREMMATANWALLMYPGLSAGCAQTLMTWGSDEQKATYLGKVITGEWGGTMCLTEPQCGTDLAQVKCRAEPQADGTYKLNGTKIFISAGEHDLTANIIHIVLAKLPDAPAGTKGLSLFLVPRHVIKKDGSLEKERNVKCAGIESKMGIHGNATCQLSFDGSTAYIIGAPHEGMKQMFTFMNAARIGTALQGVAHAELAYQNSLDYALERRSMQALGGKKGGGPDAIIDHPNVREHVLFAQAIAEGGRAFVMDLSLMLDVIERKPASESAAIDRQLGFLTPISKGFLTEMGLEAANRALQVWGGHGYIKGNGMEQIVRDARIATLYEGTTGVQSLDFIGRKLLQSKTNEAAVFGTRVNSLSKRGMWSDLGACSAQLWAAQKKWKFYLARTGINARADIKSVGAASQEVMMATGYLTLGYYHLKMALAARERIPAGDPDGFYAGKVELCQFYFDRVLPRIDTHLKLAASSHRTLTSGDPSQWRKRL